MNSEQCPRDTNHEEIQTESSALHVIFHDAFAKLNNASGFAEELKMVLDSLSKIEDWSSNSKNTIGETSDRTDLLVDAQYCATLVNSSLVKLRSDLEQIESEMKSYGGE